MFWIQMKVKFCANGAYLFSPQITRITHPGDRFVPRDDGVRNLWQSKYGE